MIAEKVHRHHGKLHGCAAGEKQDMAIFGHVEELANELHGFIVDGVVRLAAMAGFDHGEAMTLIINHLFLELVQDANGQRRRAGIKVVFPCHMVSPRLRLVAGYATSPEAVWSNGRSADRLRRMKRTDDEFETRGGVPLARTVWAPAHGDGGRSSSGDVDGGPRGGVLLIHGMAEHRKRYATLAETLAERGYLVWAYDHRGHGDTAVDPKSRRHIAPGNDWTVLVEDVRELLAALGRALAVASAEA